MSLVQPRNTKDEESNLKPGTPPLEPVVNSSRQVLVKMNQRTTYTFRMEDHGEIMRQWGLQQDLILH